ncbi:AAA family ATPase [Cupriavidus plantarum]|uniref:AAA family ATPase n=1 Tax=Cupriavidus plantarum TaxID=942865 RepID=UPI000E23BFD6|nr:AAA family ATPase [Cupriavidus plantarum]REE94102.1 putative ATPase [Cupriavidus plantarum]
MTSERIGLPERGLPDVTPVTSPDAIALPEYRFETIHQDGIVAFARGVHPGTGHTILLAHAASAQMEAEAARRLENEFALRAMLRPEWAILPRGLTRYRNGVAAIYDDHSGTPLTLLMAERQPLARVLAIARNASAALRAAHESGLVHCSLTPCSLLVESDDRCRLGRFDFAQHAGDAETRPPAGGYYPGGFNGGARITIADQAPAYMSPEHTGRTHHAIDVRSDLYSLGVVLYQLLTGQLPFSARNPSDLTEWIHSHVAGTPAPPREIAPDVPEMLARIALKLLDKRPAHRYQSAAGLEADLRRCAEAFAANGRIDPFEPGMRDRPGALELPDQLYAREAELAQMEELCARVAANSRPIVVALTGPSGIGKSALMRSFAQGMPQRRVWWAAGKADPIRSDVPYAVLADAFRGLVHQILGLPEDAVRMWRLRLEQALGAYGSVASSIAPALRLLVQDFPDSPATESVEPDMHVDLAMRCLIHAFAQPDRPFVLLIDDIEWLDRPTLALLSRLVGGTGPLRLLLVCTARDADAPALAALREHVTVSDIAVCGLSIDAVAAMLAQTLRAPDAAMRPLAEVVHAKTLGSPFFVRQFVKTLADERLIAYAADNAADNADDNAGGWRFDLAAVDARTCTDNVADFSLRHLQQLPGDTRSLLGGMACLGSVSSFDLLCDTFALDPATLHARLAPACAAGLVVPTRHDYLFAHDRILQAAHAWLDSDERARVSLRAGRLLARTLDSGARPESEAGASGAGEGRDGTHGDGMRDDVLFRAAGLLAQANALASSAAEAFDTARLFLVAAKRARRAAAYEAALRYVSNGIDYLKQAAASLDGNLLYHALREEQAMCWFLQGRLDAALVLVTQLIEGPGDVLQRASVYRLKVEMHSRRSENMLAVETAIAGLRLFGIDLHAHPSAAACNSLYATIQPMLAATTLSAMLALPVMNDADTEAAMSLLAALMVPASFTDENLAFLSLCQMLRLTLRHGMTAAATSALGWLGVQVCHRFDAYADGFRYGEMARRLVNHHGYAAHMARVQLPLDQLSVWTRPLSYSIECARAGFAAGVAHGDVTTACYACCHIVAAMLARGDRLDDVAVEIARGLDFVRRAGFHDVESILLAQQRFVDGLRAGADAQDTAAHRWMDDIGPDGESLARGERLSTFQFWHWLYRATMLLLADRHEAAAMCLDRAATFAWSAPAHIHQLDLRLLRALTIAAAPDRSDGQDERDAEASSTLRADARKIRGWAAANPVTFTDKALLVEAEIARREGDAMTAMTKYEQAIAHATAHGFVQIVALAHERAAHHCAVLGLAAAAHAHRRDARDAYVRWGAMTKARQLEARFPELVDPKQPRTWQLGEGFHTVDIESVIKASRALTEEIRIEGLIDKLMTIALEYAAAQRGLLIRIYPEGPLVEAIADTAVDGVRVRIAQDQLRADMLPLSMFHTATRTAQVAMVGASMRASPFAIDPYLAQQPDCSAICIPMVRHKEVIGALYLENRLVRDAFTLDQTRLLELVAAQAAISLRTARLYDDLLVENERRQRVERELRTSEATLAMGESVSHTGSWRWDVDEDRFYCSDELLRIYDLDPSERESPFEVFLSRMHPEDRPAMKRLVEVNTAQRLPVQVEHRIVRRDGSIVHVAVIGKPMPPDNMAAGVAAGATNASADGGEEPLRYFGTVTDITARRHAEDAVRNAQADLARVARATTVGQLTASIAHEINQPLMSIVSNAGASLRWLARATPDIDNAREGLVAIASEGQRAGDMIRSLQSLTRNAAPVLAPVDIHEAIRHILAISRSEIARRSVTVQLELGAEPSHAFGDSVQLQQVILNLVVNAIEAMGDIEDRPRILRIATRVSHGEAAGDAIEVSVGDTGVGIGAELVEQVFEPFYTTKVNGMGMGLAICRSIIEAHRGHLRAAALVPYGSAFSFTIPMHAPAG